MVPKSGYYLNKDRDDYTFLDCKPCWIAKTRERQATPIGRMLQKGYAKKYRDRVRDELIQQRLCDELKANVDPILGLTL